MVGCQKIHKRLIIVITGANAGIGFGICHRFLVQLSQPAPPDASFYFTSLLPDEKAGAQFGAFESCSAGVTIIMACRDVGRAEAARTKLYGLLDAHIAKINNRTPSYHYAVEFRTNLQIQIHRLDLSDIHSVLHFGKEISQKYPYISHLICNAGVATYSHIDYLIFFRQCLESPLLAVRHPAFNVQTNGAISKDNLGFVWQCNVFGHYVLVCPIFSRPPASHAYALTSCLACRSVLMVFLMATVSRPSATFIIILLADRLDTLQVTGSSALDVLHRYPSYLRPRRRLATDKDMCIVSSVKIPGGSDLHGAFTPRATAP
ncbi:hypothetical protein AcW1_001966 [Taiwanofungus camphoratus]|nr:hypothetical protein AcW1_001966 [Antrodia cinnamomea]